MKRFYEILSVIALFLLSFNVNGQSCDIVDVEVVIENIIWDANNAQLNALLASQSQNTGPFGFGTLTANPVFVPHPVFHIVEIDFERPANFTQQNAQATFDIAINVVTAHYEMNVPVYLVFDDGVNSGVTALTDTHDNITGFHITPAGLGNGVASTATIMGRSPGYTPDPQWDCIEIVATKRKGKAANTGVCFLNDAIFEDCTASIIDPNPTPVSSWRVDMTNTPEVNVYPNPVQDNLFIDNNGLEISEVSIMTLDGQVINHKAAIRQGIDRTQINTSQLDTGIYLLKLETPTDNIIKKIIIR